MTRIDDATDEAAPQLSEPGQPAPELLIAGVRLVDAERDESGWLTAAGGAILAVGTGTEPEVPVTCRRIHGDGRVLTPGLIDMHSHGCGGGTFDGGDEAITTALRSTAERGVTRAMPSLVTVAAEEMLAQVERLARLAGAGILGVHLEGPFISPAKAGAHEPAHMRTPDHGLLDEFLDAAAGTAVYLTVAPELPGALDLIAHAADRGAVIGIGHTEADYDTARSAVDAGARVLTHAFNAMNGIHHRAPGPVVAALTDDRVTLELILDGVHVAAPVADVVWRAAGDRIALVTDAMSAAGRPDGAYTLGGLGVTVSGGIARLDGTDTIAGSTLSLDAAVRTAAGLRSDLRAAVGAATAVPARSLGVGGGLGLLEAGMAADLVLWTEGLTVAHVFREGHELV